MTQQVGDQKPTAPLSIALEAWSEGLVGGSLLIMSLITLSNMRKTSLLHKLILVELLIALPDSFPMFFSPPTFGWYLSSSSTLMIVSWTLHNVVAWMKSKPFLTSTSRQAYIGTVVLVQPYWVLEIVANFLYFNQGRQLFVRTRPFEALCRDPWWIFTTINLFWNIKHRYEFGFLELIRVSPRFAILLGSMSISLVFIILDVLAVTSILNLGGLNPFWKLAFIFKCFTDTIVLDDFKTALDKLTRYKHNQLQLRHAQNIPKDGSSHDEYITAARRSHPPASGRLAGGAIYVETDFMTEVDGTPSAKASVESTVGIVKQARREVWQA